MSKCLKTFRLSLLCILLNCIVFEALGVSISARRLYLDPENNTTDIRVLNMQGDKQSCLVEIRDIQINKAGLIELTDTNIANSAKPLIRLAPRRFTISNNGYQIVKLLYRRKPGIQNGEYQGVLAIKCKTQDNNSALQNKQVSIAPSLVHNVPVIVRTGRLPIQVKLASSKTDNNILQVTLEIIGERSITGDLALINAETGELISEQQDKSIYAQQPLKQFSFNLAEHHKSPLLIRFTENPKFGGELVFEQSIK